MFRHATASATRSMTSIMEQPKGRSQAVTLTTREVDAEIFKGPYRIREIKAASCSSTIAPWINPGLESRWLVLSSCLTWLLWSAYIYAECNLVIAAQKFSGRVLWQAWCIIAAEVGFLWPESFVSGEVVLSFLLGTSTDQRKRYRLMGDTVPSVDICIACCGESVSVILDTLAAAAAQDYPPSRYRVFVLDDSRHDALREEVSIFAEKTRAIHGPLITYLARTKLPGVRHYFKAGNVRHGFETSAQLGCGSEVFAALDADMIVASDWLRRLVPHLIVHDRLALACPPQHFYNIPREDPLAQDSYIFARILEPLRDRLGGASCTGSGYVMRRKAIEDVGGLPLVDVGEDIMLSYLLTGADWQVAFVKEEVQHGLAPDTFSSYIKQRMRWTDGSMLISRAFYCFLPGAPLALKMSWGQRCSALLHTLSKVACVTLAIALAALPLAMFPTTRNIPIHFVTESDRLWPKRLLLASYLMFRFNRYLIYGKVGLKNLAYQSRNKIWSAPYIAYRTVLSSIPGFDTFHFEPSGSVISKADERSALRRQPLPGRLLSADILMHIAYCIVASAPLVLRGIHYTWPQHFPHCHHGHHFFPMTGALLRLLQCVYHFSIPVQYMLYPPTVPERRALIAPDEKGVNRPKSTQPKLSENGLLLPELLDLLIIYLNDWA